MSAPSRANYTMRRNADENRVDLPLGVKAVYKHFDMDDDLPSTDLREAIEMRKQMTELLRRESFKLHKWLTILSEAFSVWDPRVLLPFSIRSKIILQNLNRS